MKPTRRAFLTGITTAAFMPMLPNSAFANDANPGLILGQGPKGRCDDERNGGPIVRWHPDDKRWWMWYYCRSSSFPKGVASGFGSGSIALAKSSDGIHWQRFDGPHTGGAIMQPNKDPKAFDSQHNDTPFFYPGAINDWDGGGVASPQLVRVGNKLHLYYYGFADRRNLFSPRRGIGLAISETDNLKRFQRFIS